MVGRKPEVNQGRRLRLRRSYVDLVELEEDAKIIFSLSLFYEKK